jgi:hypothetical protein
MWPPAGHLIPNWKIRNHPTVKNVFARLWNCRESELRVSWDRVCIQRPRDHTQSQRSWLHADQGAQLINNRSYQGLVTLVDMPADGGTLIVVPGSHLHHAEFFAKFPEQVKASKDNWVKYTEEQLQWLTEEKGLKPLRLSAKAGQLVLWDSRTVHQGSYPLPKTPPIWRYVTYVCMKPLPKPRNAKDGNTLKRALVKKRKAFETGRVTSHWAVPEPTSKRTRTGKEQLTWQAPKLFPVKPQMYGKPMPFAVPNTVVQINTREDLALHAGESAVTLAGLSD